MLLDLSSAFAVTITYDFNGGQLPNGQTSYQTDSSNTDVILENPTKTGYIFAGWCNTTSYTYNHDSNTDTDTCLDSGQDVRDGLNANNIVQWTVSGDSDTTYKALWEKDKFQIKLTGITANGYFGFKISAKGDFWVDWGDGVIERINKNNTDIQAYTHTYAESSDDNNSNKYTVRFGGLATRYSIDTLPNTSSPVPAITFGKDQIGNIVSSNNADITLTADNTRSKIRTISGSLGAIFPTLSGNTAGASGGDTSLWQVQPSFGSTFSLCENLIGAIPAGLFTGIQGQPIVSMFSSLFYGCSNLGRKSVNGTPTYSIPSELFGGLSGKPANGMFNGTFSWCSGLTGELQNGLFGNISGEPAPLMFSQTFYKCSNLTGSIPSNLFGKLYGNPQYSMFEGTFQECSNLTGYIPPTLFGDISRPGVAVASSQMSGMFGSTGLVTDCSMVSGNFTEYDTGFSKSIYFNNKVSCIAENEYICPVGEQVAQDNMGCVACNADPVLAQTTCPVPTSHLCATGNANSTHVFCGESITWMNGETEVTSGMTLKYTPGTAVSLPAGTKSSLDQSDKVFIGWCLNGETDTECAANNTISVANDTVTREIADTLTGDLVFYARYETCADNGVGMVPNADHTQCECAQLGTKWADYVSNDMVEEPELYDFGNGNKACIIFAESDADEEIAQDCMKGYPTCDWDVAGIKAVACKYNASTGDYDTCTKTMNICDAEAFDNLQTLYENNQEDSLLAIREFMGLDSWNNFFDEDTDYSEVVTMTDEILAQNPSNTCGIKMTCAPGSYLKVVNDEPIDVLGTVWAMDNNKYAYCDECGVDKYCSGGTWPAPQTANHGQIQCPTGYNTNNTKNNVDITDCVTTCPDTPTCVANASDNCAYVSGVTAGAVKHYGDFCNADFNECNAGSGYKAVTVGAWAAANNVLSHMSGTHLCSISDNPAGAVYGCSYLNNVHGSFEVNWTDFPIQKSKGIVSCNTTTWDLAEHDGSRVNTNANFAPTATGNVCWWKVTQFDDMYIETNGWVYNREYPDAETCAQLCGAIRYYDESEGDWIPYPDFVATVQAIIESEATNKVCDVRDDIPINWGMEEPGVCTFNSDWTAPDTEPTNKPEFCSDGAGCVFLGWKAPENNSATPTEPEPTVSGD